MRKRFSMVDVGLMMAMTVLCATVVSYAVSVPHAFVNGTVADANEVNENFDALADAVAALENTVAEHALSIAEAEEFLQFVNVEAVSLRINFDGVNVYIRNGMADTATKNGLGNLIVGYNEDSDGPNDRTGSHNIVVGVEHTYSSWGGLVAGEQNTISGEYSSVSGGGYNEASGIYSSVSGGLSNDASANYSSISGGLSIDASVNYSTVVGDSGGVYVGSTLVH